MPRQIITHILIRYDEECTTHIDTCEINVEGNLTNDLMIKLIDYFQLKISESCESQP